MKINLSRAPTEGFAKKKSENSYETKDDQKGTITFQI
jgi:hypothetical protein